MLTCIKSQRQRTAAEYALKVIQSSCIKPYIQSIYLYGSCARGEEKYSSDVDLFLELSESFRSRPELKKWQKKLHSCHNMCSVVCLHLRRIHRDLKQPVMM